MLLGKKVETCDQQRGPSEGDDYYCPQSSQESLKRYVGGLEIGSHLRSAPPARCASHRPRRHYLPSLEWWWGRLVWPAIPGHVWWRASMRAISPWRGPHAPLAWMPWRAHWKGRKSMRKGHPSWLAILGLHDIGLQMPRSCVRHDLNIPSSHRLSVFLLARPFCRLCRGLKA